ncbi:MAG: hypothetical protein ACFFDH_00055 [Promethearchaeota archaeon]
MGTSKSKVITKTHAQLTEPGNGEVVDVAKIQPASGEYEVTVATIDTDVTVRMDYSDDGFSTVVQGAEYQIGANGTFVFKTAVGYRQMRPVFVAETGGTAVTLDIKSRLSY